MPNGPEQPINPLTITDAILILTGVSLFARWLLQTSLGWESLARSRPRRNCMGFYVPMGMFLVWFVLQLPAVAIGNAESWQGLLEKTVVGSICSLVAVALMLAVARVTFARGLAGLGLRLKTAPKDLGLAFLTLWAVWPLVLAAMSLTFQIARHLYGRDYEIPQHEALKLITESVAVPLQVAVAIMAIVVAPLVEELLFRGLIQTTLRSYLQRPWLAVALTSLLFARIHADMSHWPSLFILAMGLGYSYESSGSLLRPIFMHALFNGINIVTALTQPAGGV